MRVYHLFKQLFLHFFIRLFQNVKRFNLAMGYRRWIKTQIKLYQPSKLNASQKKDIKKFYKSYGYRNVKTHWHRFLSASTGIFSVEYVPEDIFHPLIATAVNNMVQWPVLLDKNLSEDFFADVKQPKTILKNINGFYYANKENMSPSRAIKKCLQIQRFTGDFRNGA